VSNISVWQIVYAILFEPLQILFELIFSTSISLIENKGFSIIALSLAMNILVLPLYRRADKMQEEEREIEERLQNGVNHIKKTFKGDERVMMLQTYYRQNNYKPTYVLKGATSLLLQIPFFLAAYNFLSNCKLLQGVKFGLINDLGSPDALISVFDTSINLLPIVMTAVNLISSFIYSKRQPLKAKVQLYVTAVVFLVLLYNSPSGLVFYWTLNNVFSLFKTIFLKQKNPKRATYIVFALLGLAIILVCAFTGYLSGDNAKNALLPVLFVYPLLIDLYKSKKGIKHFKITERVFFSKKNSVTESNKKLFTFSCVLMAVLSGGLIPSSVIVSSPQEFVFTTYYRNPLWYIVSALCISFGTFVVWCGIFYSFSSERAKTIFEKVMWALCGTAIVNYMVFANNFGQLNSALKYNDDYTRQILDVKLNTTVLNLLLIIVVAVILIIVFNKIKKAKTTAVMLCVAAFVIMTGYNAVNIYSSVSNISEDISQDKPSFSIQLSKNKQNVIVFMLDRALGEYVPYIMNERPELKKQFDGFTYYRNTVSLGPSTNMGAPALFGGYEYTPIEMNTRSDEKLADKNNESIKMLPVLFDSEGYNVTVCNPPYANYQWISDLSIYDEYPQIKAYNTTDSFISDETKEEIIRTNDRNFYLFGIMKTLPLFLHPLIYDYNYASYSNRQDCIDMYKSNGTDMTFENEYNMLKSLPDITQVEDNGKGSFLMMVNNITHEPNMLQEPDYEPAEHVDNYEYDTKYNESRFLVNGIKLNASGYMHMRAYHTNMAAFIQIGKWLDYLKANGVYDNTKIIIVADHGYSMFQIDELIIDRDKMTGDIEAYYPLLMVKDFNAKGFSVSDEFMTNADVPTIAVKDSIKNPVNPFTKKKITNSEKFAHDQYIQADGDWNINKNNGNQFVGGRWYKVHDSIWDKNNWEIITEDGVLTRDDIEYYD